MLDQYTFLLLLTPFFSEPIFSQVENMTRQGEDGPALAILYKEENNLFHFALMLTGSPVPPGPTEAASREAFERHVHRVIAGGMDKSKNLVENTSQTRVEGATSYFRNVYHRLDRKSYQAAVKRLKGEFPPPPPPPHLWGF